MKTNFHLEPAVAQPVASPIKQNAARGAADIEREGGRLTVLSSLFSLFSKLLKQDSFRCPAGQCKWIRRDGFPLKSYRPVRRKRLVKFSFQKIMPVSERGNGLLVSHVGTCRPVFFGYGMLRSRAGSRRPLWSRCRGNSRNQ
ncbi:hypothetical protein NPIL_244221 [Nephila pilipes]|uniref:Uncharacterized protein n=1 Tax=Nephila pilipes TaxID=299642 RepID=A0A8X6MSZ9_NEPPI|nr:hypothetical protein NPIL_244221 [Nephila pilipes]